MTRYVTRRLLLALPVVFVVAAMVFLIMRIIPGDVVLQRLMEDPGANIATKRNIETLREQLGVDRPLYQQFFSWLWNILRLNPGDSFVTQRPVLEQVRVGLPLTVELAVLGTFLALLIALPTGVLAAVYQDTWADHILRVVAIAGLAVPNFWLAILLLVFTVNMFHWAPAVEYTTFWANPLRNLQQMILPALVLGASLAATMSRMTRSMMLEVLREDYIRTARAKGLQERTVVITHALKNAALPVLTILSIQFGHLLAGTVVIETVFNLPGIGLNLINGIMVRDFPMVQFIVVLSAIVFVLINLAIDVTYGLLDPRIRYT